MKAIALALSVIVPAIAAQVAVEPREDLGFRIVRTDNISGHHEAVEIIMSSIVEMVRASHPRCVCCMNEYNNRAPHRVLLLV